MRKQPHNSIFFRQWLMHAFFYWAATVGYECFIYYLKLLKHGNYLWHQDGSPTTVWDRFYEMNRYQYNWLWALFFTFGVELLRAKLYSQKKFSMFVFSTIATGIIWSLVKAGYANLKFKQALELTNIFNVDTIVNFVAYAIIYAVVREFVAQKLYKKEIRLVKSESEISALKAQVNPHFFFNTFNYVYGTALHENALKTAKAIEMMTEMMRYTMSIMQDDLVSLAHELRFVKNYVELQLLRLPERPNISIDIDLPDENKATGMIVPMLIVPLLENAFKYAISIEENCFIKFGIELKDSQLQLKIENSIPVHQISREGLGTGINNVRRRLKLLYPKRHLFEIRERPGLYQVQINVPLE
ncbi:MAG: histidine kinase [Bacteroidota bacterium]